MLQVRNHEEFHASSGLVHYLHRFYAPGLQRWLNRDPISESGGNNLYGFTGNDPVNLYDGLGLAPGLGQLTLQSISRNALSDAWRFGSAVAADAASLALNALVKEASMIYQYETDPLGFFRSQFQDLKDDLQAVADAGAYWGRFSADPCERQRALAALQDALANPETYGHAVFAAESFLAAGLFAPEAAAAEGQGFRSLMTADEAARYDAYWAQELSGPTR